jgi:type IV secretory pathway TrbF-like protein
MHKTLTLIFAMLSVTTLAQEQTVPTRHIVPEDVAQESIHLVRFSTNSFAVRWTYTEAGAKKVLAFREAHEGQKVRTVVGSFESPPGEMVFHPMPPIFTNYVQWKEGWLKHRTDKFFGVSEGDAKKILEGLKKK